MVLDKPHTICLNRFCDDYEDLESIIGHDPHELDGMDRDQVAAVIRDLHVQKLINAYQYDESTHEFRRVPQGDPYADYFFINKLGREVLNNNWKAEYGVDD